jgi:hypothetical protein
LLLHYFNITSTVHQYYFYLTSTLLPFYFYFISTLLLFYFYFTSTLLLLYFYLTSTSQTASQPASQPPNQPASQLASQPASQAGSQPASQPASQPGKSNLKVKQTRGDAQAGAQVEFLPERSAQVEFLPKPTKTISKKLQFSYHFQLKKPFKMAPKILKWIVAFACLKQKRCKKKMSPGGSPSVSPLDHEAMLR